MKDLPGIEEYTGVGLDIPGAVSDSFDSLPETIFIEDDITLKTAASAPSATKTSSSRRDPNGPSKISKHPGINWMYSTLKATLGTTKSSL